MCARVHACACARPFMVSRGLAHVVRLGAAARRSARLSVKSNLPKQSVAVALGLARPGWPNTLCSGAVPHKRGGPARGLRVWSAWTQGSGAGQRRSGDTAAPRPGGADAEPSVSPPSALPATARAFVACCARRRAARRDEGRRYLYDSVSEVRDGGVLLGALPPGALHAGAPARVGAHSGRRRTPVRDFYVL